MIGIPYARPNDDSTVTCPVCGERIAERYDVFGERLTNAYGEHYERLHRGTPAELAEAEHADSEGDALAADMEAPRYGAGREPASDAALARERKRLPARSAALADDRHALTVSLTVRVPADADAANVAAVIMAALHVGLEGAADCGIDAPDPSDVDLSFVDDAQDAS